MNSSDHQVIVDWHSGQNNIWWNETCAMVIEIFGLPGGRYMYSPNMDHMTFTFKNKKDAVLCKMLLSERISQ